MSAVFDNPDGIQTAFTLDASKVGAWAQPRKVSELAEGVELLVGIDKSWLRGTVTPKQVNVDDWVIAEFDLSEGALALTLKRRLVEKEALQFRLRRSEAGLAGEVEHPGQPNAEALNGQLGASDLAALDRVWQALRLACRDVLDHKSQLLTASLDGRPVFEGDRVIPFVVRLVTMFGPTVREIATRSPNEFELSLKLETDTGRREEVYLRREQLVNKLQPLSSIGREIFAPLGLDTWVPGTTSMPPPVASVPPAAPSVPPAAPSVPPAAPSAAAAVPGAPPPSSNRALRE
jgi:hypothetical protein